MYLSSKGGVVAVDATRRVKTTTIVPIYSYKHETRRREAPSAQTVFTVYQGLPRNGHNKTPKARNGVKKSAYLSSYSADIITKDENVAQMYYIRRRSTQRRPLIAAQRRHSLITPPTSARDWPARVSLERGLRQPPSPSANARSLRRYKERVRGAESGGASYNVKENSVSPAPPNRALGHFEPPVYTRPISTLGLFVRIKLIFLISI